MSLDTIGKHSKFSRRTLWKVDRDNPIACVLFRNGSLRVVTYWHYSLRNMSSIFDLSRKCAKLNTHCDGEVLNFSVFCNQVQ